MHNYDVNSRERYMKKIKVCVMWAIDLHVTLWCGQAVRGPA